MLFSYKMYVSKMKIISSKIVAKTIVGLKNIIKFKLNIIQILMKVKRVNNHLLIILKCHFTNKIKN